MTAANLAQWPDGAAAFGRVGRRLMEIILHLGAHRTGTTTFQHYLRQNKSWLNGQGVAVWTPPFTRKSLLPGLFQNLPPLPGRSSAHRAVGRISLMLHKAEAGGATRLIISDENLMGSCAENLREGGLYPSVARRAKRLAKALRGQTRLVLLGVRRQDDWWASAAALAVARGHRIPEEAKLAQIAGNTRGWRDVIFDLASAFPEAKCEVLPFDVSAGRPDLTVQAALEVKPPLPSQQWHNRSASAADLRAILRDQGRDPAQIPICDGRWQPFTPAQQAQLHEMYLDDLHWLRAGADGLAKLTDRIPGRSEAQSPGRTG